MALEKALLDVITKRENLNDEPENDPQDTVPVVGTVEPPSTPSEPER